MPSADTSPRPFTIATSQVGHRTIALTTELTTRRLLAFVAGIGEWESRYSDDLRAGGLLGHPGLVESLMWNARHVPDDEMDPRAIPFGVHAATDWRFRRAFRAGDVITTQGETIAVRQIPPGVISTTRYRFVDSGGEEVAVMDTRAILRGLRTDGPDRVGAEVPDLATPASPGDPGDPVWSREIPILPEAAQIYTACADIYNPIHTERAYAQAAGLPDPILHGSATFAFSLRELMRQFLGNDAERLRRVAGQFRSMVTLGEPITVRALGEAPVSEGTAYPGGTGGDRVVFWETRNAQGATAVANGVLVFDD